MATLYLIEQNTVLRKSSDHLLLTRKPPGTHTTTPSYNPSDVLLEIPCNDVDHVMVFGNIQITTQALQELLQHGIELALFTFTGKLLGQLTPPQGKNVLLRIAQFAKQRDERFVLQLARQLVCSKIAGALALVADYTANHPDRLNAEDVRNLRQSVQSASNANDLGTLLGCEGAATACYYRLLGAMFNAPWKFDQRSRQPPQNPVNAVLSFGYVVVMAELQSLLDGVGFDPYLGFYHQPEYGRPSLALDLLEEFRHVLIDRLAVSLFNRGVFRPDDFYAVPEGSIHMNNAGKRKFFQHYENILGQYETKLEEEAEGKNFRALFRKQIYALAATIQEGKPFAVLNKF